MNSTSALKLRIGRSHCRGFTLIEILVVMAIISILAVVAVSSATSTKAAAVLQAADEVSDLFALARSEAIRIQGSAYVIVDAYADPANPLNYLHRVMIVDNIGQKNTSYPNSYIQSSPWQNLPNGVFYYQQFSGPPTTTTKISIYNGPFVNSAPPGNAIFTGDAYVFSYSLNGQCPASQFVVVSAAENIASNPPSITCPTAPAPTLMAGFYMHPLGRPTFFADPQLIPTPTPSTH